MLKHIRAIVPSALSGDGDDCQVTIDNPSGDRDAQQRAEAIGGAICNNLTTNHPQADGTWYWH